MNKNYTWMLAAASLTIASAASAADTTAAPAAPPPPKWETSASLGATVQRGNTKTITVTGDIQSQKKWDKNEVNLRLEGTYGENDGVKNAQQVRGSAQYNRLFTDRAFGYLRLEGLHDDIADIKYRFVLSPGAGYYFIKNANTQLRGEVGPGLVYEKQGNDENTYATLRIAERWDQKLAEKAKLWQTLEFLPQVDRWGNYIINFEIGVESQLTAKLFQRTYIQDTYHSEPAAGRLKNDFKLVAAIAYKF